jgi:hypothetical protein
VGLELAVLMFAHGETVTRLRAKTVTDPYSGEATTEDWTNPDSLDIYDCGVADGGSLEPLETARNAVDSDFDVIVPPGSDVTAQDRLVVRGLVCQVAGRPFDWTNPFTGWQPGMIVRAKIRES